jgi:hypothetical protein
MTAFKLDKLPKVSILTKADDFFAWKSEILDAAEFAYFKDITNNEDDRLGLDYSDLDNRRRKIAGFLLLRNSVDRQYHDLIDGAETPADAWKNIVSISLRLPALLPFNCIPPVFRGISSSTLFPSL